MRGDESVSPAAAASTPTRCDQRAYGDAAALSLPVGAFVRMRGDESVSPAAATITPTRCDQRAYGDAAALSLPVGAFVRMRGGRVRLSRCRHLHPNAL